MELPPRATRGKRMRELMGEECEADEEFWGQDFFAEEARDGGYETESETSDTLDSDFEDPDDDSDGEGNSDPEDDDARRKKKKLKPPGYKPKTTVRRPSAATAQPRVTRQQTSDSQHEHVVRKSSRSSVVEATARHAQLQKYYEAERRRRESAARAKTSSQASRRPQHLHMREILEESIDTEGQNAESLRLLLEREEEAKRRNAIKSRQDYAGPKVRRRSYKGDDGLEHLVVSYIQGAAVPRPEPTWVSRAKMHARCVVTGAPAKFLDPRTGQFYANKHAFDVLRSRHAPARQIDQHHPQPHAQPRQTGLSRGPMPIDCRSETPPNASTSRGNAKVREQRVMDVNKSIAGKKKLILKIKVPKS